MTVDNQNRKISYDIDATSAFTFAYTFDIIDVATVFLSFFDTDGTELVITMVRVNSTSPAANEYFVDEDASQVVIGDGGSSFLQDQYGSDIAQLLITRTIDLTQGVSLPTATSLQSDAIEEGLDSNTLATQQLSETVGRALVIPIQDDTSQVVDLPPAAVRANQFLAFDGQGNPTVGDSPAGGAIISTAMQPVVAGATLVAARELFEVLSEAEINALIAAGDALKLSLAGGTMSGAIAMGTEKITGLGDPVDAQDAVTKAFATIVADQTANTTPVDLTVLNTWYEVAKISAFVCGGKDILINANGNTLTGSANGWFEMRLKIDGVVKQTTHAEDAFTSTATIPLTWLEKSCLGTNDITIEIRAVHASTVGSDCNSATFPSVINVVRLPS